MNILSYVNDNQLLCISQNWDIKCRTDCNVKGNLVCFTYCMSSVHSPDGSYTEDHSNETGMQFKSRSTEFDEEFDEEEPLPTIGTCKALYPFEGNKRWLQCKGCGFDSRQHARNICIKARECKRLLCVRVRRPERGHHIHGRGRDSVRNRGGQRWRLDSCAQERGRGRIRAHILHQTLFGRECQRCYDIYIIPRCFYRTYSTADETPSSSCFSMFKRIAQLLSVFLLGIVPPSDMFRIRTGKLGNKDAVSCCVTLISDGNDRFTNISRWYVTLRHNI